MRKIVLAVVVFIGLIQQTVALPLDFPDDPILRLLANSAVDIVYDGEYIWIGTSKGLSGTNDGGLTWRSYDSSNGLASDEVSSLAYGNGQLWVASSSSIISQGQSIPIGTGFAVTEDYGNIFVVDSPHQSTGAGMLAYDVSVYDSAVFAACFYGGLIFSLDGGETWDNLFADSAARQDFIDSAFDDLNNRYFAVCVDGVYQDGDTVVVWAGTAEGINQYQFIDSAGKLAGNRILDLAYTPDDQASKHYTWIATSLGLSRSEDEGGSFKSLFKSDGLTSSFVSAIAAWDTGFVIAGGYEPANDSSTGFAFSADNGRSWNQSYPTGAVGVGKKIEELVITDQSYCEGEDAFWIWAACSRGGLWLSRNGGVDWEQVVLDATRPSPDSAFNQIISLAAYGGPSHIVDDTLHYLFAGSAGGVWFINIDSLDNPNGFAVLHRLYEIDSVPSMIADVAVNLWTNVNQDDSEIVDTTLEIALATRPASGQVGFAVLLSDDFGQTWDVSLTGWNIGRLDYADSSIVAASTAGLLLYSHASESWGSRAIYDQVQDYTIDTVLNVVIFDRIKRLFWVGAEYALAKSAFLLPGTWQVDTVNLNPELFDHNIRARSGSGESGLSGDFVVAIEVQYHEGERYIWVAANSTGQAGESDGINLSTNNGRTFDIVLNNINAWNFAFDGGDVYAATSSGLLKTSDFGDTWDTMEIVDAQTGAEIYAGTEFFGVAVAEGVVWAASDDGMAFSTDNGTSWTVERTFQALPDESGATVYASPLPCSPYSTAGGRVRFHYKFPEAGSVTIKIYDFAMHLVSTPVDGQPREANLQYDEDSWDMRNDNGDLVSAGPYYFKVEHSSGREEWGKILVIP